MPKGHARPTTRSNTGRTVRAAGANMSERISETTQENLKSASKAGQVASEQVVELFDVSASTSEEMVRRSAAGMEALSQASASATQTLQDLSGEWVALARERIERNMQMMEALSRCRTLPELFALQGEWANSNLQLTLEGARRIAEVSTRLLPLNQPFGRVEGGPST